MSKCDHANCALKETKSSSPSVKITTKTENEGPRSITILKQCEKLRLRPLPMHIESLVQWYHEHCPTIGERATLEQIGRSLVQGINERIPCVDMKTTANSLPYCRVCDEVFDEFDSFFEHIQSEDHSEEKMNDSLPMFAAIGKDEEPLTTNQIVAREFMNLALLEGKQVPEVVGVVDEPSDAVKSAEKAEGEVERKKTECTEEKKQLPMEELRQEDLSSLCAEHNVEFRLRIRPCAECSRIWKVYGSLVAANPDMAVEFAFRSHPLHPCAALMNITLEVFRAHLVNKDDKAVKPCSTRPIKFPSKELLKEISNDLSFEVSVPLFLGTKHTVACSEEFQVAMHCRAQEVRNIYAKFKAECEKRDQEGRPYFCDVCRLSLPDSQHFLIHLLSESHDKKMLKAPSRQSELYNPLCQMVCFIDSTRLLARRRTMKKEKKREEVRREKEKEKERKDKKEKEKKEKKKKKKEEKKKKKKEEEKNEEIKDQTEVEEGIEKEQGEDNDNLAIRFELDTSPFMIDTRGFLVVRPGYCANEQRKEIKIIQHAELEKIHHPIMIEV